MGLHFNFSLMLSSPVSSSLLTYFSVLNIWISFGWNSSWLCWVSFAYCTFCLHTQLYLSHRTQLQQNILVPLDNQVQFWIECLTLCCVLLGTDFCCVTHGVCSVYCVLPDRLFLVFVVVFHYDTAEELLASLLLCVYLFLYVLRIRIFIFSFMM